MKTFIKSQFGYCPLVWKFCGRQENNGINHLHERVLKIVYDVNESSFENLFELDNSASIHHRKIRLLSTELHKVKHNLSNQVISELINIRNINFSQIFFSQKRFSVKTNIYNWFLWNILLQKSGTSCQFTLEILIFFLILLLKQNSWKSVTFHVIYAVHL